MSVLLSFDADRAERWLHRDGGPLARGRRAAKALAETILPASLVVWRGREGRHHQAWHSREQGAGEPTSIGGPRSRVALSFDDGPTPLTEPYLDLLEQLGVRATFFLVGELCAAHPERVRAIAERGHELAGHGYTHRPFTTLSRAALKSELLRTSALLPRRPGKRQFVRPPYGAVSPSSLLTCARQGFTTVLWSLNSCDWRARDAAEVERAVGESRASAGDIVLLHEGQSLTIEALPRVVGSLKESGHELVTVGELLD
jgi:peptidoglycan/xylan/chitin deacetylase (PgdA/CDA1 family)